MPRVELPDNTAIDFPDSMSGDQINDAVKKHLASQAPAAAPPAAATGPATLPALAPVDSGSIYRDVANLGTDLADKGSRFLQGAGGTLQRWRAKVEGLGVEPNLPADTKAQIATDRAAHAKDLAAYEAKAPSLGTSGRLGEFAPEVLATAAPIARVAGGTASLLPRALGAARPLIADAAVNAGYEATKEGLSGGGITDVVKAAGLGAAGAGAGHVIGGLAQRGAYPVMSGSARTLVDNGITPTPGQMFGRAGSGVEEGLSYAPVVGGAISRARNQTLKEYSRAETNAALRPLGVTVNEVGEDAVAAGRAAVDRSYNAVVDQTHMPAIAAQNAISDTQHAMGQMPLLTQPQIDQVQRYIDLKIQPELSFSQRTNNVVPGRTMKNIDTELGDYAHRYMTSTTKADNELGQAFLDLQRRLRDALTSNDPSALARLQASNAAFRGMVPVRSAASKGAEQIGEFSPMQMFRSAEQNDQVPGQLNRAARELIPGNPTKTVGVLRRALQMAGGGSAAAADPLSASMGWLAANAAYSRPVRAALARGLPGVRSLPFSTAQLAAQVGREAVNPD